MAAVSRADAARERLRDTFALHALTILDVSAHACRPGEAQVEAKTAARLAVSAYRIADAMLLERSKGR